MKTNLTAKEYLSQAAAIRRRIRQIESRIVEIREEMEHPKAIRYDKDMIQSSPNGDEMTNFMIRLDKEQQRLLSAKNSYLDVRIEIESKIKTIMPEIYADILYMRYMEERNLADIAEELSYSYEWVCRLHGRALQAFSRAFPVLHRSH